MMPTLRIKYVLTTQYVKLLLTALIFIGICTVLLLTNVVTPALAISPYAEDPQPDPTTHRAGVSQAATVTITKTTDAFTEGQKLEDRTVFPLRNASAPVVTASADGQDTTINTIEVRVTYTASITGNPEDRFYTNEETVATKRINGTSGTLETVVDIQSVFETKNELEAEFGSGVTVTPTIESIVTYQYTSLAGRTQRGTVSVGGDITAVGELYSLPSGSEEERHTTGPPAIDPTAPHLNAAISAVGGAFIVLFGTTLIVGHRNGRKELAQRIQVKRYAEWVTEIESYTPRGETHVVQVQTLSGLVNLAIDMNERVLYTANLNEYLVMDGHTMYKYRSEDSEIDGRSEFFGFSDPNDMPGLDTVGNPFTGPSPDENIPHEPADPDSETGSDSDAEGDA